MATVPSIKLNDGTSIPQLGFGVFQIDPSETAEAVERALTIGYRHIDTAEMYKNEREVGEGIRAAGVERSDIYVTSKLNNNFHEPDEARKAFDTTLSELGSDYVDLFLIHWPLPTLYNGDFVSTWQTLEQFKADGRARSVGVSTLQVDPLQGRMDECDVVPAVNQIELHPYFQNREVASFCEENGIAVEAWSPIAQGDVLDDPAITQIAEQTGRSVAQVVLRWHVQKRYIVFPKSTTPERIEENFRIFDFELSDAQVAQLDGLGRGEGGRRGPNPGPF